MKWDPDLVLEAVRASAWPVLRTAFAPSCCVAATRLGILALERFGVVGHAVPVKALAGNAPFARWLEAIPPDADPGPPPGDARYVQIETEELRPRAYSGHLVICGTVRGRKYLLDLTAPQFHRPDKGIEVPEPVLMRGERGAPKLTSQRTLEGGGVLSYAYLGAPKSDYRESGDWTLRGARREIAVQLVAAIATIVAGKLHPELAPRVILAP